MRVGHVAMTHPLFATTSNINVVLYFCIFVQFSVILLLENITGIFKIVSLLVPIVYCYVS